ncbi:hypothetical protein BD289DRAFT_444690 [Coniella lustricola]|uniref:Uncharacterized protein n=1 Tax=Coniella lustricola TaxID=2025994 RepID=A0A2T2ZVR3_9PEZI|nr:hypothetical protein BD289DRAFT_444690 [Coniella lustricola]
MAAVRFFASKWSFCPTQAICWAISCNVDQPKLPVGRRNSTRSRTYSVSLRQDTTVATFETLGDSIWRSPSFPPLSLSILPPFAFGDLFSGNHQRAPLSIT